MTVYLLWSDSSSSRQLYGVFSSEQSAEKWIASESSLTNGERNMAVIEPWPVD